MDEFEKELKVGFLDEAAQLLADAEQCFLNLETSPNDPAILEKIFRLAHNLKGSAKAVGFSDLGEFTHELESYLLKLRNGSIAIQESSVSLLLRCNDHLTGAIQDLKADLNARMDNRQLLDEIHAQMSQQTPPAGNAQAPTAGITTDSMPSAPAPLLEEDPPLGKIPDASQFTEEQPALANVEIPPVTMEAIGDLLAKETERELETVRNEQTPAPLPPQPESTPQAEKAAKAPMAAVTDESIRVSLSRLERLLNFVGEMVILQTVLREQVQLSNQVLLRKTVHQLGKVTKEVQDISMSLRMIPLKQTFQKMQRIVRDTSSVLNKKVHLILGGEETEVDKTVLENLSDPLVHLIRNAVDHGIEPPDVREAKGKSAEGQILLCAFHQSGNLIIEIRDDGAGLDPKKLTAKAIEKGLLKPGTVLPDKDAYQLIFQNGFSTKAEVTDVSGRGVGMDVVKTNIEKLLQGEIQIETEAGKGTCFRIRLPLTLAIIDGMVVLSDKERYVIPLSHVHESIRPDQSDINFVTGIGEVFSLRGEHLPLYRLSHLLNKKAELKPASDCIAIVVRTESVPFSVLVDDIIGQQQVVIKKLGPEHQNLKGFSGSAILGDGRPSLILELAELVAKFRPASIQRPEPRRIAV